MGLTDRFIRIEENQDDTCTITMSLGELTNNEELSTLIAMSFDGMLETFQVLVPTEEHSRILSEVQDLVTEIPNSPERLEN